jgi:hypothetical protein
MTRVDGKLVATLEASARQGRIARAQSIARDLNPYRQETLRVPLWAPDRRSVLEAWWQGWDQTDRELRGWSP